MEIRRVLQRRKPQNLIPFLRSVPRRARDLGNGTMRIPFFSRRKLKLRYGGLENATVNEMCNELLAAVDALPRTDAYDKRRKAAQVAYDAARRLAEADPQTPLSDALNALAGAIQFYIIHRAPIDVEARRVRAALDQMMRQ